MRNRVGQPATVRQTLFSGGRRRCSVLPDQELPVSGGWGGFRSAGALSRDAIEIPIIRFDAALLDVDAPSLPDIVDELRFREIPILMLSAYDLESAAPHLREDQQLRKPYTERAAINRLLTLCSARPSRPTTQERTTHSA